MGVLRVIGIILGVLLLIFLALILYLLFSPFTYSVDIRLYEKSRIAFRIGDLLRLFSVKYLRKGEGQLTIEFLFGLIKLHPKRKKEPEEEKKEEKSEEEKKKEKEKAAAAKKERSKKLKKVFEDKEAFKVFLKRLMKLLKRIFPQIRYADFDFALQSPDSTGTLTGVMSLVPFVYGRHISIRPDFSADKAYGRGRIVLSGKIFIFYVLYIIIGMFTDKRSKKFLKALIAFIKESRKSKNKK